MIYIFLSSCTMYIRCCSTCFEVLVPSFSLAPGGRGNRAEARTSEGHTGVGGLSKRGPEVVWASGNLGERDQSVLPPGLDLNYCLRTPAKKKQLPPFGRQSPEKVIPFVESSHASRDPVVSALRPSTSGPTVDGCEIRSHHLETMGNHCSLVFTGESSFQGFLGGAGFRPSTVCRSTLQLGNKGDHLSLPGPNLGERKQCFSKFQIRSTRKESLVLEKPCQTVQHAGSLALPAMFSCLGEATREIMKRVIFGRRIGNSC